MAERSVGGGHGSERSAPTPGTRGLRAIETAVLRVRESQGRPLASARFSESPGDRSGSPPPIGVGSGEGPVGHTGPRFSMSIGALVLVVAIGTVVLVLELTSGPGTKTASARSTSTHRPVPIHSSGSPTVRSSGSPSPATGSIPPPSAQSAPTTAPPSTTTSPPALGLASGNPVIASLDPAAGQPGQQIVVMGANFLSSSGEVVAAFNGQTTATSCPSQSTCTVTVPPPSGGSIAQVTITTSRGTSNAEAFVYGGTATTFSVRSPSPGRTRIDPGRERTS
jgi:IPT/TIG domain